MLLNLFADNKPNLSVTPHWTASLHAVWNLDTAELENVDFRPGPIDCALTIKNHASLATSFPIYGIASTV